MLQEPVKCALCGGFSRGEPKCRDHTKRQFVKLDKPPEKAE